MGFAATPVKYHALRYAPGDEHGNSQPNRIKRAHNRSRIVLEEVERCGGEQGELCCGLGTEGVSDGSFQ